MFVSLKKNLAKQHRWPGGKHLSSGKSQHFVNSWVLTPNKSVLKQMEPGWKKEQAGDLNHELRVVYTIGILKMSWLMK